MDKIVMENPRNNIRIVTTKLYEKKWKDLGFIVLDITLLKKAA